ncbi:MAG: hypothetical protein OXC37_01485 [Bdellovibrionaceae bacterium]|nr:hypothetical protein [Pseudobdellovibrionaceae bacterium]
MEYIIFMITIQSPFLYLIWRLFQKNSLQIREELKNLRKQNEHIVNFMDTLKLSFEKMSEDIYGNGKVNSRIFQIETSLKNMQKQFKNMELYTGVNTSESSLENLQSSSYLKEKDFR